MAGCNCHNCHRCPSRSSAGIARCRSRVRSRSLVAALPDWNRGTERQGKVIRSSFALMERASLARCLVFRTIEMCRPETTDRCSTRRTTAMLRTRCCAWLVSIRIQRMSTSRREAEVSLETRDENCFSIDGKREAKKTDERRLFTRSARHALRHLFIIVLGET